MVSFGRKRSPEFRGLVILLDSDGIARLLSFPAGAEASAGAMPDPIDGPAGGDPNDGPPGAAQASQDTSKGSVGGGAR